ncbi:PREDICTED: F-box [Prunus dulcis]|uniref:PREDICTED: F-box n=1 Tax=Prunus dulcis TaxID=3755 RepID=A0A5E4G6F4_PRUDU|nr:PREDICTED: F-box [Prunus dulcis]
MGDGGANVRDIILSSCGSDFDPEWASLPLLVVFLVLDKLMEPIDHVRFAAVCKEWSCLAKDYNRSTQRWSPMLMIPTQSAKSNQTLVYSDCEGKIYKNIQGLVYAADHVRGSIHSLDLNLLEEESDYLRICYPAQPYYNMFKHHPFCPPYVVKSTKGDLLHVVRFCELKKEDGSSSSSPSSSSRGEYISTHFMVFKVPPFNDEECESYEIGKYVELESLGDEALFVGDNYSVSVLASKFGGCQPNCIYFTDDSINFRQNAYIACDMGMFNLEDRTIAQHCPPSCWEKGMPTPFWITPPFSGLY